MGRSSTGLIVLHHACSQRESLYKNISIPPGGYRFAAHQLAYKSAGNSPFQWGTYYTGDLKTRILTAQYRPNPHLALAINGTLNAFRLPKGNFAIALAGLQVS